MRVTKPIRSAREKAGYRASNAPLGRELQGIDIFLPADEAGAGIANVKHDLAYISLTHTLSNKTFYEARLSYYRDATDTTNVPGVTSQFGGGITEPLRKDQDGVFTIGPRRVSIWINDHRARLNFKLDYSSQINKNHFIKTGIDLTRHTYWWNQINWPQAGKSRYQLAGVPYEMGQPIHPIQSAFYLQDKMEFEGIIVNLGIRYDRHDHNGDFYSPLANNAWGGAPMTNSWSRQRKFMPRTTVSTKSAWSPRLGVSHPITANAIIRFSYGIFHQMPGFWHLYSYEWRGVAPPEDFNNNGQIDDTEWLNKNNQRATTGQSPSRLQTLHQFRGGYRLELLSGLCPELYDLSAKCRWSGSIRQCPVARSQSQKPGGTQHTAGLCLYRQSGI